MNKVVFRKATIKDLPQISRQVAAGYKAAYRGLMDDKYLDSLSDKHWLPLLQKSVKQNGCCLIAECEKQVMGTAVFGKANIEAYPDDAELYAIYLLPQQVGTGLGHALYTEAEKEMLNQGFEHSVLEVLSANKRAIGFYKARGYHKENSFTVEENGMLLHCDTMRKKL